MAMTSMSLCDHWETFFRNDVGSGRFGSASKLVHEALRAHLAVGADQARRGEFVTDYSPDRVIADLDREGRRRVFSRHPRAFENLKNIGRYTLQGPDAARRLSARPGSDA